MRVNVKLILSSGAVITCFYDLGLSWLGFEHSTFGLRGQCSNRLRQRSDFCVCVLLVAKKQLVTMGQNKS